MEMTPTQIEWVESRLKGWVTEFQMGMRGAVPSGQQSRDLSLAKGVIESCRKARGLPDVQPLPRPQRYHGTVGPRRY